MFDSVPHGDFPSSCQVQLLVLWLKCVTMFVAGDITLQMEMFKMTESSFSDHQTSAIIIKHVEVHLPIWRVCLLNSRKNPAAWDQIFVGLWHSHFLLPKRWFRVHLLLTQLGHSAWKGQLRYTATGNDRLSCAEKGKVNIDEESKRAVDEGSSYICRSPWQLWNSTLWWRLWKCWKQKKKLVSIPRVGIFFFAKSDWNDRPKQHSEIC